MATTTHTHRIVETGVSGPSEVGALGGSFAVCSCGFRTGNSLGERWAAKQGAEHAAYMNRRAA